MYPSIIRHELNVKSWRWTAAMLVLIHLCTKSMLSRFATRVRTFDRLPTLVTNWQQLQSHADAAPRQL